MNAVSDDLPPDVEEAARAAWHAPAGPAAIALWESAVARADAADCAVGVRMRLRLDLVRACVMGAKQYGRAFAPFAVVLAEADRDPQADWLSWHDLLWKYKWLAASMAAYVAVPRERVLSVMDDFADRCAAHGYSPRPAENYRAGNLWTLGEEDAAAEAFARFEAAPRDALSDCRACDAAGAITHAVRAGDDAGAVDRAAPLLDGRLWCAEEPERTHAKLLGPLTRLGRPVDAAERHRAGLDALRRFPAFTFCATDHLLYLARVGDPGGGEPAEPLKLLRRWVRPAGAASDENRLGFLTGMRCLLERIAGDDDRPRRVRLPDDFPVPDAGGPERPSALAARVTGAETALCGRFDARNGNDAATRRAAADRAYAAGG